MSIELIKTSNTDWLLQERMGVHYSSPRGFVGRNICYAVFYDQVYYGHIVGGSATRFLPGRNEYFGIDISEINGIINNVFYSVSKVGGKYPIRNFTSRVVERFCEVIAYDWYWKYGDSVIGFETLVELPRTGELYRRAGWVAVGVTKGYTCKRVGGSGTDGWSGRRVWNRKDLRPKRVFTYRHRSC
jgi:hypothetical protein